MLRESEAVTEWSQWKKIKGLFDHDPRYKAVDGSTKREELFKEHLKTLKDKNKVGIISKIHSSILCNYSAS